MAEPLDLQKWAVFTIFGHTGGNAQEQQYLLKFCSGQFIYFISPFTFSQAIKSLFELPDEELAQQCMMDEPYMAIAGPH